MSIKRLKSEEYSFIDRSAPLLEKMRSTGAGQGRPMEDGDPEIIAAVSILSFSLRATAGYRTKI